MTDRDLAARLELRQMAQAVLLHYREERQQKEIAKALGISHSKVSRLLKRAMREGLIRVEITLPKNPRLEVALVERYGLRDAVVVTGGEERSVKENLGAAAARYFERVAADGVSVGVSCGFTLYWTIHHLREGRFRDLELYPLSAEATLKLVDLFPNTLVGMMAAKYRPRVSAYALPVQLIGPISGLLRERRRLMRNPGIRRIFTRAQSVDIALLGIGMIGEETPGFCSLAEFYGVSPRRLAALGVVGEINYQPFDREGRLVNRRELRNLTSRVLAVSAEHLRELSQRYGKYVIAVAGGKEKLQAIRGAMKGRFANVLVTDETTALALSEG